MTARAILLAGSAALLAVPASAGVTDFRLPPSRTPSPTPTTVGPVDPDAPPRPAPTPTPTATVAPAPAPAPVITLPAATPTPRATPTARPTAAPPTGAAAPAPSPADTGEAPAGPDAAPTGFEIVAPPPAAPVTQPPEETDDGGWPWGWIAGLALLLGLLGAAGVWLRRRIGPRGTVLYVPDIEKPRVPPREPEPEPPSAPAGAPEPAPAAAQAGHPLHITIEPLKLTQTVMNATLSYRLSLTNAGEAPLEGLSVAADLVAAHASLPREALLAMPATELPERHALPSLAPGETAELKGELRLPLSEAMPIRQGTAVVFVPLARFRAGAAGAEPRCFTLVVGQPSPRGAIQPHRLDLGPRSTEGLTGLAF